MRRSRHVLSLLLSPTTFGDAMNVISKPMFTLRGFDWHQPEAPGALFFSDRAVKTTGAEPQFLCVDRILSVQSSAGSRATVTLLAPSPPPASEGMIPTFFSSSSSSAASSSLSGSDKLTVRLRLIGDCAVCVSRRSDIVLQCRGTPFEQLREIDVEEDDALAILCNLSPREDHDRIFRAALSAMAATNYRDVEYCAEEMLLSLKHSGTSEGTTAMLGFIGRTALSDALPPLYSSTIE